MSTTQSENSDGTTNRTIRDIWKDINNHFDEEIRTFMVNKYSESQMKLKYKKGEWSKYQTGGPNQWRHQLQCLCHKWNHRKQDFSLGVNVSPFLCGTANMACYTPYDKKQDEYTPTYSETQPMVHQLTKKHNRCKPTPIMRHWILLKRQSPNNNKQTVLSPQMKEANRNIQPFSRRHDTVVYRHTLQFKRFP